MCIPCRAFVALLVLSLVSALSAEPPQPKLRNPEKEHQLRDALGAAEKTAQETPSPAHLLAEADADTQLADFLHTPLGMEFEHTPSKEETEQFLKRAGKEDTPELHAEELRLYRHALEIYDQTCGPDSTDAQRPNHLQAIENLADYLQSRGQFAESEPLLKRSVEMMERHPELAKPPEKTLAYLRCDWAWMLRRLKHPQEAEVQYRKTIEEDQQDPVPTEGKRLRLIMAYKMLDSVGKHEDALRYAVDALGIDENHWKVDLLHSSGIGGTAAIHDLQILTAKFSERRRYEVAECLQRRALAFLLKSGPQPQQTVSYLAFLLMKRDRAEISAQMARHLVQAAENQYGPAGLATALPLHVLAEGLSLSGHSQASKLVFERVLCIEAHGTQGSLKPDPASAAKLRERYTALLKKAFGLTTEDRIQASIIAAETAALPTGKVTPELEKTLGPIRPLSELLGELDQEDKAAGSLAIQTWPLDQPIAPELKRLVAAELK